MAKATMLAYGLEGSLFGGREGDERCNVQGAAVYFPDDKVLIRTSPRAKMEHPKNSPGLMGVRIAADSELLEVLVGNEAQIAYDAMLIDLGEHAAVGEEDQQSDELLDWAKAAYKVANPSLEVGALVGIYFTKLALNSPNPTEESTE